MREAEFRTKLAVFIERRLGQVLPAQRMARVEEQALELCRKEARGRQGEYLALLQTLPPTAPLVRDFVAIVTNNESYFFRDPPAMAALKSHVFPEMIQRCRAKRRVRIWSAGCSTGEEPYSVGIVLRQALIDHAEWDIQILGTDVDDVALEGARLGSYASWSLRATTEEEKLRYFTHDARSDRYLLRDAYKQGVNFETFNLAATFKKAPSPGKFDLILCRNVLIYFEPQRRNGVYDLFRESLSPGAAWISGPLDPKPGRQWTTQSLPALHQHIPAG